MTYQSILRPDGSWAPGERAADRLRHYRQEDFQGRAIVDLGCAEGTDIFWLLRNAKAVCSIGIDINPGAIEVAKAQAKSWNLPEAHFLCEDAKRLPGTITPTKHQRVLLMNSVARWIGPGYLNVWIKDVQPEVIYLESHSEQDEWTAEVMRLAGLQGYHFELLAMLPYTIEDPRPLRRFMRAVKNPGWLFKTFFHPKRRLHLGVEACLLQTAADIGLNVPIAAEINDEYLGIRRIDGAVPIKSKVSEIPRDQVALISVFDWLTGNVDLKDSNGNWVEDQFKAPIRGERHDENILYDGSIYWWIDFGHCFAHLLWLTGGLKHDAFQPFSACVPEDIANASYAYIFKSLQVNECHAALEKAERAVFSNNRWLPMEIVERMRDIYKERIAMLKSALLLMRIGRIGE